MTVKTGGAPAPGAPLLPTPMYYFAVKIHSSTVKVHIIYRYCLHLPTCVLMFIDMTEFKFENNGPQYND